MQLFCLTWQFRIHGFDQFWVSLLLNIMTISMEYFGVNVVELDAVLWFSLMELEASPIHGCFKITPLIIVFGHTSSELV